MKRIASKHREDLLLSLLADMANGTLKGERFIAYDVSAMSHPTAIQLDDDASGSASYDATLSDLHRLAQEGFLEVDERGPSLVVTVVATAHKYRDELRTIELAKGQAPEPR